VVTPFLGVELARDMFDWWAMQGSMFTRAWAALAVVFGLFVIYAITPSRRSVA
jgi:hypothetical protein